MNRIISVRQRGAGTTCLPDSLCHRGPVVFAPAFHLDIFGQDAVTSIAVMLGAELGTCSDTLLATIGRGWAALKTGLFDLGFNAIPITLGLLLIQPFTALILLVAGHAGVARQIAHSHMLFKCSGRPALHPPSTAVPAPASQTKSRGRRLLAHQHKSVGKEYENLTR